MNPVTAKNMSGKEYDDYLKIILAICYTPSAAFTDENGVYYPNARIIPRALHLCPQGQLSFNPNNIEDISCIKLIVSGTPPNTQVVTGYRLPKSAFRPRHSMVRTLPEDKERNLILNTIDTKQEFEDAAQKLKKVQQELIEQQTEEDGALPQDGENGKPLELQYEAEYPTKGENEESPVEQ